MRIASLGLALLAALAACAAGAQLKGFFKDKLKPGLYENRVEMEAPGMARQVETSKKCVTVDDFESAMEPAEADCVMKNFKAAGNTATFTLACSGSEPRTSDFTITASPDSYTTELKMTATEGGKTARYVQRSRGRYLGPCTE